MKGKVFDMIKEDCIRLTGSIHVSLPTDCTKPILHAWDLFVRDAKKSLGKKPQLVKMEDADIVIDFATETDQCPNWPEAYAYKYIQAADKQQLKIMAHDELGLIYGMLYFTEKYFEVDPFWFWADLSIPEKELIELDGIDFHSKQAKSRFRGWFVNDEVCLIGWTESYPPPKEVWHPVFETLLRCGGNMVIPGTDLPKDGIHYPLAQEMGLWVSHHHAEPLGAEMFLRAYPGETASYLDNPQLFEQLWTNAIQKQKNDKVVWVLSFRGQGDAPFWSNDPQFDTDEKRGEMISYVVQKQYDMIHAEVENPVCSMALYGEIAELYAAGHISVPEGVIKIWADNGYGKMVSRRQGNESLRIPALPKEARDGKNGIYYHVTFHDLQASNHLALLSVHPSLIAEELHKIAKVDAMEYVLINSGNIRPHIYYLNVLKEFWLNGEVDEQVVLKQMIKRFYHSHHDEIYELYMDYFEYAVPYGENDDDKAGDEFYHHPTRKLIGHWLKGKGEAPAEKLLWATGKIPFSEQLNYLKQICLQAIPNFDRWLEKYEKLEKEVDAETKNRLQDQLLFHIKLHETGAKGLLHVCLAYELYQQEEYARAFVKASDSLNYFEQSQEVLDRAEHGKWKHFFRADWLTNVKNTINHVDTLRKYIRMQGDNPDFFLWYKEYIMPETEKYIYLENTHRKTLSDDEIAQLLREKFAE